MLIKLDPITSKAVKSINEHGDIWKVIMRVDRPDTYFFQSRKPQLYIIPVVKSTRNPREEIGDNYTPPTRDINIGARWISAENDPDFDYSEHIFKPGRG